jgi:hypothetical protein
MGSKCASTFCAKRSGNRSSRSTSGKQVLLLSSTAAPPLWPSAASGSDGGHKGAAAAAEQDKPAMLPQLVLTAIRGGEHARLSGGASLPPTVSAKG